MMKKPGLCNNLKGWEVHEGGNMCIPMADSCLFMAEINTTLQRNYPSIKNKFKKKENENIKGKKS